MNVVTPRLAARAVVKVQARWLAAMVTLGSGLFSTQAAAFCRTTNCDFKTEPGGVCELDENRCPATGIPLSWPDACVTFGTHVDGSRLQKISFERADAVARRAFQAWISADCGEGRRPSIGVVPRGEIFCDQVEFNHKPPAPNTNLIVFRDAAWPHVDVVGTIALTTVTFERRTGQILDADIEVNSANINMPISTGDTEVTNDLQSVLIHEIGHLFGLSHTLDETASMNATYDAGDLSFRSLSRDDIRGICAAYPPGEVDVSDCTGEEPRYGFSRHCGVPVQAEAGCFARVVGSAAQSDGGASQSWWVIGAALAMSAFFRRRTRCPNR